MVLLSTRRSRQQLRPREAATVAITATLGSFARAGCLSFPGRIPRSRDIVKTGCTVVADAILVATSICAEDLRGDMLCPNVQQNIMVVSTPRRENANQYVKVCQIVVKR
ncbi:hypothetical protein HPB51_016992 [Rhipicephalus microplus]|uniref:Uncharacterized protein n=1 Tax=Rhipicephalus microplus TaxID=6941 RepID=A0A9J6F4E2_RHIMP|nr:hypothetical protein HPB51_016992 [Rhipicephalus microplus]